MSILIDPELERQLQVANAGDRVQAIVSVHGASMSETLSPDQVEGKARLAIQRAQQDSGEAPSRVKVFRNMESFAVEASPRFLRALMRQKDDIGSILANRQPEPVVDRQRARTTRHRGT